MRILRNHVPLFLCICLAILSVFLLFSKPIEENVLALIPKQVQQKVILFNHSPLSKKLIVVTKAPSASLAQTTAHQVGQLLLDSGFVVPPFQPTDSIISEILSSIPSIFSSLVQQEFEQKITSKAILHQFEQYYQELFSFQSLFIAQKMRQDPLNFSEIIFDKWAQIGKGVSSNYADGFLANKVGTTLVGLYDTPIELSDIKSIQKFQRIFLEFQATLPVNVTCFFLGGIRYTLENVTLIKRDLTIISLVGTFCFVGIFLYFFRTKKAFLIYLLPLLVLPPAALVTQLVFGHISGITLGFGSVVVGLSVDYAIYVYFALQQTQNEVEDTLQVIQKHLWCNFLTSSACFASLLFSSIEVFRQIAILGIVSLSLAFFISLKVFPFYFKVKQVVTLNSGKIKYKVLPFKWAIVICLLMIVLGSWGFAHLSLTADLNTLNSTTPSFQKDRQIAQEVLPLEQGALLFSIGKTKEEALSNNEDLSDKVEGGLPISTLFVSDKTKNENLNRWGNFWSDVKIQTLKETMQPVAKKFGFAETSFQPFWQWLNASKETKNFDFSLWYNPIEKISNQLYAVVNLVPNNPAYAKLSDNVHSFFISASQLQLDLAHSIKNEAIKVVLFALLLNIILVYLLFKNIKETLLCFIPVTLGACLLFGILALFKINVNMFGLIFLPLLVGLGIDYAIFQLMKYRIQQEELKKIYSTHALLAAGLSTLFGFGILILAKHSVLFMMGLFSLIGIGGAITVSLFLLPSLREHWL